ncbi:NAD(P)-dependent oxidoreductase [Candidatus Shapirobacteria bacterium]|nr:NAD(P)-dependent oxidoreductase [Candidatus Shapirobacteria bacterium]
MSEILTTGLSGLVGSRLPELFPDQKYIDLSLESGHNILKLETLEKTFASSDAKVLIHFAAFTDTTSAWNDKGNKDGLCYQINVVGTQNIINMCRQHNIHLIHISTDSVFDGTKQAAYVETDKRLAIDWYGETKLLAEMSVDASKIPATIVRIAFPYRAKYEAKLDFVRKIISKLEKGETCKLFTDQFTTPTFVDDIATGLMKIVDNPKSGIYHLVGSSSQSIYSLGLQIAQTFGFDPNLIQPSSLADYLATPNARPYSMRSTLSNEKFITNYSFTPSDLASGLAEMKRQITS